MIHEAAALMLSRVSWALAQVSCLEQVFIFIGFGYKEDQTQNYDPERTSYAPFSLSRHLL